MVWDDITFKAGSTVGAGVDFTVTRFFIGRELWTGPQYEFGLGIGLHWMDTSAFIEGQVITSESQTEFRRGDASFSAPLPNVGAWHYYSPSARWLLTASVDWLSASIGKYDDTLWNASAGVNYQVTDHFGLDLSYQFFSLDAGISDTDWNGRINLRQNGPLLALTANW